MSFAERVRFVRKERGLTQDNLAKILRITKGYISKIEKGEQEPSPPLKILLDQWISGEWDIKKAETPEEKLARAYKGTLTKSVGVGWRSDQDALAVEETDSIQEQVRRYDPLTLRFRYLFDFIRDTYGDNQVAIEDFADRLKQLLMTDGDYSEWAGEKRAEMEESLKKRASGNVVPGPLSKVSNSNK